MSISVKVAPDEYNSSLTMLINKIILLASYETLSNPELLDNSFYANSSFLLSMK
jgi:hypothetical protein